MKKRGYAGIKFSKCSLLVLCHIVLLFWILQPGFAQVSNKPNKISQDLVAQGFENVFVTSVDSTIVIGYENRRFRFEPRGLHDALKIIGTTLTEDAPLILIVHYQKLPMLYVQLNSGDFKRFSNGNLSIDDFSKSVSISLENPIDSVIRIPFTNNSNFKADFVIVPQFRAQFGNFDRPVQANINIIPELNILLAKGLSFRSQLIIPVQNSFFFDVEEQEIRPGLITLNQMIRLDDNVFFTATAGYFTLNRAGTNLEFKKYFGEGKFAIGASIGYTVYHTFVEKPTEYFEEESYFTGLLSAEYRYLPYDLTGRIQAGKFLYNDNTVRFDVFRQFGEVNIGFFAMLSQSSEINGGFHFSVPIPPGKFMKFRYLRIRQARKFGWEYRAKGFVENGSYYKTGNELFDIMLEYNPDFFKKRLIIELQ